MKRLMTKVVWVVLAVMPFGALARDGLAAYERRQSQKKYIAQRGAQIRVRPMHAAADPNKDTVEIEYIPNSALVDADPLGVYCAPVR